MNGRRAKILRKLAMARYYEIPKYVRDGIEGERERNNNLGGSRYRAPLDRRMKQAGKRAWLRRERA